MDAPQIQRFFEYVVNPVVQLIFALAVVYFVYGVFTYIRNSNGAEGRETGGRHIVWSTIGMFIMVSVWGIIRVLESTIGVTR